MPGQRPIRISRTIPKLVHPMQQQHKIWQEFHYIMGVTTTFSAASVPEILEMKSTTTEAIMGKLKHIFAVLGLREQIISDNGVHFTVSELQQFCAYSTMASYHPRSNGEVKRLVETFKNNIEKTNLLFNGQLQNCLINFLARYSATPHTVMGQTPEIVNSRQIRTLLDFLHPGQQQVQQTRLQQ